jgi:alpha-glucosidase
VWDETIVLPPSAIGEVAAFARRSGRSWFLAVLNGPAERTLRVPLSFLAGGPHDALVVRDVAENAAAVTVERAVLTHRDSVQIALRAGGGFVARLTPAGGRQ